MGTKTSLLTHFGTLSLLVFLIGSGPKNNKQINEITSKTKNALWWEIRQPFYLHRIRSSRTRYAIKQWCIDLRNSLFQ